MKKYIFLFVLAFIGYSSYAQIGIGTKTPDESSALDVKLPNKGVLLSRVSLTSTTDVTTIPSAANSLTVYNTATAGDVMPGYYYWNTTASKWIRLMDSSSGGWGLKGNSATNPATDFIGTTDDNNIIFKRNKVQIGMLAQTNISFGEQALQNVRAGIRNVGIGSNALNRNSSGNSNTALGYYALNSNSTSFNTGIGSLALSSVISGESNTAVGSNSSLKIVKGRMNTSVGYNSLYSGVEAIANTAIGSDAGYNIISGYNNTAIGYNALFDNTNGNTNTAIGNRALLNLKATGAYISDDNVGVGSNAGTMLTSGNKNIFLGSDTKPTNTAGSYQLNIGNSIYGVNINRSGVNASIGINVPAPDNSAVLELSATNKGFLPPRITLKSTTDNTTITNPAAGLLVYNTAADGTGMTTVAPGYYYWNGTKWSILASSDNAWNTSGNSGTSSETNFIGTTDNADVVFKRGNVSAGLLALQTYNTSLGVNSYKGTPSGSYSGRWNTAIGYNSLHGNTSGEVSGHDNVAVGSNSLSLNYEGTQNVAIGSEVLKNNTKGSDNTAIGFQALAVNNTGNNNVANGVLALSKNISSNNVAMGHSALFNNVSGSGNTAIGYNSGTASDNLTNTTTIGNGARVSSSNTIQLGNAAITTIAGQVPFTTTSDRRLKEDIKTIPLGLDFVNKLHPVEYVRKNNELKTKEWG
ncbi:tail fiber domain-containing protein [Flavobacterium sp. 140616W15]|uniref:tail fiber domain-containing protein n=1 Tax=Flavobacterium sp. 140616W15 TaxID=2478552 RepID=UPI001F5CC7DC|nr:tail fiber domain-containing protein [Flavobacterium sp. 140616W15]